MTKPLVFAPKIIPREDVGCVSCGKTYSEFTETIDPICSDCMAKYIKAYKTAYYNCCSRCGAPAKVYMATGEWSERRFCTVCKNIDTIMDLYKQGKLNIVEVEAE